MVAKQYNYIKYGKTPEYEYIDMLATGKKIKSEIKKSGYKIKELQEYLNLSCPQPIYRWCKGTVLPSIDHLYALSRLFHVHMEDLIVAVPNKENEVKTKSKFIFRMYGYMKHFFKK